MHPQVPDRQGGGYAFTLTVGTNTLSYLHPSEEKQEAKQPDLLRKMAQKIKEDGPPSFKTHPLQEMEMEGDRGKGRKETAGP